VIGAEDEGTAEEVDVPAAHAPLARERVINCLCLSPSASRRVRQHVKDSPAAVRGARRVGMKRHRVARRRNGQQDLRPGNEGQLGVERTVNQLRQS
jgi:hypothetical protein